jgi:uncharacterized membrane protein
MAVGAAVVGGVLFAFSTFVMKALDQLPADRAVAAMQSINRRAVTPLFMTTLFGTGLAGIVLGVDSIRHLDTTGPLLRFAGTALYLTALLVTAVYHVPHNEVLARLDPMSLQASEYWHRYVTGWTAWNHVRAAASIAAAVLLAVGGRLG